MIEFHVREIANKEYKCKVYVSVEFEDGVHYEADFQDEYDDTICRMIADALNKRFDNKFVERKPEQD